MSRGPAQRASDRRYRVVIRPWASRPAGPAALASLLAGRENAVIATIAALGLVSGLPAGSIMSLPARVLAPQLRAVGMGIYFTLFYLFVVSAPIVAGSLSSRIGSAAAAFDLGALMLALCFPAYWVFNKLAARAKLAG